MKKRIADSERLSVLIDQIAEKVMGLSEPGKIVLLGVQTRGVVLARRIREYIKNRAGAQVPLGTIDITLYRDDFTQIDKSPVVKETRIDFDIEDRFVVLVDDVLYTGRTVRAALSELTDFGRPAVVRLVTLVDRGGRELPIQADVNGESVEVKKGQRIKVHLTETDGEDAIYLMGEED